MWMFVPGFPLPRSPVEMLEPFRIANRYGLFASMTHARYEIEFQGSADGKTWTPYPFRYKPQDAAKAPGNLRALPAALRVEFVVRVARLVAAVPIRPVDRGAAAAESAGRARSYSREIRFRLAPPQQVRAVIYQYWFTDLKTKRETGRSGGGANCSANTLPRSRREPDGKNRDSRHPHRQPFRTLAAAGALLVYKASFASRPNSVSLC